MPKRDAGMARKGGKKEGDDKIRVAIVKDDKVRFDELYCGCPGSRCSANVSRRLHPKIDFMNECQA